MTDRFDIVAAFTDGESVAAADLSTALAHEDARAYLIDVLALRGLATGAAAASVVSSGSLTARRGWSALSLVAAAALVVFGIGTGFAIGRNTNQRQAPAQQVAGSSDAAGQGLTAAATAPAPTHVIRIENGVTWNERAGGN